MKGPKLDPPDGTTFDFEGVHFLTLSGTCLLCTGGQNWTLNNLLKSRCPSSELHEITQTSTEIGNKGCEQVFFAPCAVWPVAQSPKNKVSHHVTILNITRRRSGRPQSPQPGLQSSSRQGNNTKQQPNKPETAKNGERKSRQLKPYNMKTDIAHSDS